MASLVSHHTVKLLYRFASRFLDTAPNVTLFLFLTPWACVLVILDKEDFVEAKLQTSVYICLVPHQRSFLSNTLLDNLLVGLLVRRARGLLC